MALAISVDSRIWCSVRRRGNVLCFVGRWKMPLRHHGGDIGGHWRRFCSAAWWRVEVAEVLVSLVQSRSSSSSSESPETPLPTKMRYAEMIYEPLLLTATNIQIGESCNNCATGGVRIVKFSVRWQPAVPSARLVCFRVFRIFMCRKILRPSVNLRNIIGRPYFVRSCLCHSMSSVVCRLSSVVCDVLYCGETAHLS